MRPRTLAVLAVVVALLAAFIWFIERDLPSSGERAERAKRILSLQAEDVEGLTIEWDGQVVELRRRPPAETAEDLHGQSPEAEWRLTRPIDARADRTAVSSLVSRLTELEKERTLEGVSRADVGLAEPRARVTLETTDGAKMLEVGAEVPASTSMTLAVAGRDEVHVVASAVWTTLTKTPGDWRDKNLFAAERDAIERLVLSSGATRLEIARRGEQWWLESPVEDRADRDAVDAVLTATVGLRAEAFVDPPAGDEPPAGLESPVGSLEAVVRGEEQPFRLTLGGLLAGESGDPEATAERHARVGEQVVRLSTDLGALLERPVNEWRSLDWSVSEVYRIERAVLEDSTGAVELRREGGDWLRDGEVIAYGPATDPLFEITSAQADRLIDEPLELSAAELTVTLESDDGTREVVELFAAREDGVPARASDRDTALLLSAEVASAVGAKLSDLRSARVESAAAEAPGDTD